MIIHDVEQGDIPWMQLRLGIPTTSQYHRIITPKTLKPAGAQKKYRAELVAEYLLGSPLEWGTSAWMERGTEMEDEARKWYEFDRDVDVEQVGFITRDDEATGGSPDGLVGEDGGIEIKCLGALNHVQQMLTSDLDDYKGQCQGLMYLTDRQWWDLVFYNPDLPKVVHRMERDQEYIDVLVPELDSFIRSVLADQLKLKQHKVVRPWDIERDTDEKIAKLKVYVGKAEASDTDLISYAERDAIERAITLRDVTTIEQWIEDLQGLPWKPTGAPASG